MFDWLFEEEVKGVLWIKVDNHRDWIHKSSEIFRIINKHDTLRNKMLYYVYAPLRSGLLFKYLVDWSYVDHSDTQIITVRCWESAWKELEKLPWVTATSLVVKEL